MNQKTCTLCRIEKPLEQFRRLRKGAEARHCYCRCCINAYARGRTAARRRGELGRFARELRDQRHEIRGAAALCERMLRRFGGVDGLSRVWWETIETARSEGQAGRRFVLASISGVISLITALNNERSKRRAARDSLSIDELKALLLRTMGEAGLLPDIDEEEEDLHMHNCPSSREP